MDRLAADRMFVQVVRMGGFSAAAARAGVSPGQASKLVSRLESYLGLRLLTRTTRAISLTPEGEAYLAIRAGQPRDSTLVGRKLAVMRIQVVAAPAYLAAHGTPQRPEDLRGHAIITDLNFAQPDDWQFQDSSRRVTLSLPGRLRFSNAEACVSAAIAGLGVTRVPDFIAAPAIRDGALTQLFALMTPQQVPIMAITPSGRHMPARVRLLVDFLRDRWGPDHRWDD